MKEWVILFCVIALVFVSFAIAYVITSAIREGIRKRENAKNRSAKATQRGFGICGTRSVLPTLACGAVFAASGLLIWRLLSQEDALCKKRK